MRWTLCAGAIRLGETQVTIGFSILGCRDHLHRLCDLLYILDSFQTYPNYITETLSDVSITD